MEHKHAFPADDLKLGKIIRGEVAIDGLTYRPFNARGYGARFDGKVMCFAVTDNGLAFLWGTAEAMAAKQAEADPTHVFVPEEYRTGDWRWWGPEGWEPPAPPVEAIALEDLTKKELQSLAEAKGIDTKGMNKAEIIAAICAAEPEPPAEPDEAEAEQPAEQPAEDPDGVQQLESAEPAASDTTQ
jgi:hypothetical protein